MSSPKTFNLPNSDPPVPVRLLTSEVDERQVLEFAPLSNWAANLLKTFALQHEDPHHQYHEDPYVLRSIDVQNADFSPNGLESLKAKAEVSNGKGERLPGITFLRGHYVSIMLIIHERNEWGDTPSNVVLTVQPRVAAASLSSIEIPSGKIDAEGYFSGEAADEIKDKLGIVIRGDELFDMTAATVDFGHSPGTMDPLPKAVWPSPGVMEEHTPLYLCEKVVGESLLRKWHGQYVGHSRGGEKVRIEVVDFNEMWMVACRDVKGLAAMSLHEGLKRRAKLPMLDLGPYGAKFPTGGERPTF